MYSFAAVAQLDRVLGYEPRGRGFDSCQPRHFRTGQLFLTGPFFIPIIPHRAVTLRCSLVIRKIFCPRIQQKSNEHMCRRADSRRNSDPQNFRK